MSQHRARLGLLRTRWSAIGAAVAVTLGAGGLSMAQAAIDMGDRPVTVSIAAERILDARTNLGLSGRFADATPRNLKVTGSVPVASGGSRTVVPADAIGVLVNVTVVTPTHDGFLSLRPKDATGEPTTSTVNFVPGAIEPNAATVDLKDGQIQIWVETSSDSGAADVLIDVVGYTIGHTHDDRYYTETEVDAALAGKADAADTYTKAEVDSGLATKVTGGEVTMSYGPGSWTENSVETLTVFDQFSEGLRMSGDGSANMMLVGPNVRGGEAYTLKDVRYCITQLTGGGFVTQAVLIGHKDASAPSFTADNTNRTATACHVVTPSTSTRGGDAFVFNVEADGGGSARVRIGSVTATWDTRTTLGSTSADFRASTRSPEQD